MENELKDLAKKFNSMLENIEKLMEVQNQFVSDASHELIIPIAAIVGLPVVVLGLILAVCTGHRIKVENKNGSFN